MTEIRSTAGRALTPTPPRGAARATEGAAAKPAARVADGQVAGLTQTLARLTSDDLVKLPPDQLLALLGAVAAMPAKQQANLKASLLTRGLLLDLMPDVHEVSLYSGDRAVTAQPGQGALRVTDGPKSTVFQDGQPVETMETRRDEAKGLEVIELVRGGETQYWDARTGEGIRKDGSPVEARPTPSVPGEEPRKPLATQPENKFHMPGAAARGHANDFPKRLDAAVVASGGKVIEPYSEATKVEQRYNCHSFATTGAQGSLADPFDKPFQPRWVNNPSYELLTGPFTKLAPSQRVHVGDVILYADANHVATHTGKVIAVDADGNPSRVESKWGNCGLYDHGAYDVPQIYGHIEAFFRPEAK